MVQGSKIETYKPFYPTTVGTNSHDITFQKLPAYSISAKPNIKDRFYSPGPGAYPEVDGFNRTKKYIPKSLYPEDRAHKYSIGVKGKEPAKFQTPSPATYPLQKNNSQNAKNEVPSIYPKGNANKFSIGTKREQKYSSISPGPAIYPRDADTQNNINSLYPRDKANKFTMCPNRLMKNVAVSPGPAVYPCSRNVKDKFKVATIDPTETRLAPTIKGRYDFKNKHQLPAANTYPILEEGSSADPTKKMIPGKRSPVYSLGIKHSPKQHILILNEDTY